MKLPRELKNQIPTELRLAARRKLGRLQPWDPGANLTPPTPPNAHRAGAPDFVGVGVQKAGTSWWYDVIASHPDVHHPAGTHKERHFFNRFATEAFSSKAIAEYHQWFSRPPGMFCGEWTPQYIHQPWTPSLLAAAAPQARILVLVRDPIDRLQSGLTHAASRGVTLDHQLVIDAVERGRYASQLDGLLRSFSKEQVKVLQFEACVHHPLAMAEETFQFLDLDPKPAAAIPIQRVNPTQSRPAPLPGHLKDTVLQLYERDIQKLTSLAPNLNMNLWPNFRKRF